MIKITCAKKEDCKRCAGLSNVSELQLIDGTFITEKDLLEFIDAKGIMFVAKENDELLGYISGDILAGGFAYVSFLVVEKTIRSKGIGKQLLNYFEEYCRTKGAKYTFLHAITENEKTLNFYQRENYAKGKTYVAFGKSLK